MKILLLIILSHVSLSGFSQVRSFSTKEVEAHLKKYKKAPVDKNNKVYGAGSSIDGSIMRIVFNEFKFNKESNMVAISGTVYQYANTIEDELRIPAVQVFLAKEFQNTLKNICVLGYSSEDKGREGNFEFSFKLQKRSKLYFHAGPNYFLTGYDIWKLIK